MRAPDRTRILVTGFLGFGAFDDNPSAALAASIASAAHARHELIEVGFDAADRFIDALDCDGFEVLLMLGVSSRVATLTLERTARNHVGALADVRGAVRGPAPIETAGPDVIESTLWTPTACAEIPGSCVAKFSDNAGDYLCNYAYYRALRRLPRDKRVGFIHVPPVQVVPLQPQRSQLAQLLDLIADRNFDGISQAGRS